MYYSYVEIEYVATSFSPARTDLAVKLLMGYSKMLTFDQSNCFVRYACIFLFSTVIQILHNLQLYIVDVPKYFCSHTHIRST
jgi:hypothetical protein